MMNDYISLILGIICAGIGGEFFVRGAVGGVHWARISPGIIGATVAAFATSSPELSVSINAAIAGGRQIALGDALGSNVVLQSFPDTTRSEWKQNWTAISSMTSIIAVAAITHPIVVNEREVAVTLAFGFTTLLLTYPSRKGFIWQKAWYFAAVSLFLLSRSYH